jgi:hypothetical protein
MIALEQLQEMERIRARINHLISSPLLAKADRIQLADRLADVGRLRAEWERLARKKSDLSP